MNTRICLTLEVEVNDRLRQQLLTWVTGKNYSGAYSSVIAGLQKNQFTHEAIKELGEMLGSELGFDCADGKTWVDYE